MQSKLKLGVSTIGKALGFKAVEDTRKTTNNELLNILYSQLVNHQAVVFYNFTQEDYIKKGYSANAEVYSIIRKIVDKANAAPCYVYVDNEDRKSAKYRKYRTKKSATDAVNHSMYNLYRTKTLDYAKPTTDLVKLLVKPNDHQSWEEMNELFDIFYFAQGEAFLYRETALDSDIAVSLHVAPANLMTPIYGGTYEDVITGWVLKDFILNRERVLDAKDVFQLKMANPNFDQHGSQLRGMSPLASGLKYLTQNDEGIKAWANSLANEGAKGIISPNHADPKLWLTPDQVKATQNLVEEKVNGVQNKNKVMTSGMPLQYTAIGLSPEALNIIEGLKYSGYKLANLWGVPPVLFEPDPTYANKKEARKEFVSDVIIPYQNKKEAALNRWLVEPFSRRDNVNYVLDYDTSEYEELKLSLDEVRALKEFYTINEVRIMLGADELEEEYANEVFVNQGMIPLSDYSSDLGLE